MEAYFSAAWLENCSVREMRKQRWPRRLVVIAVGLVLAAGLRYADIPLLPSTRGLTLTIRTDKGEQEPGGSVTLVAEIQNSRSEAVTLVAPGDGSESGLRTPVMWWSVTKVGEVLPWKRRFDSLSAGRSCGNMNPLEEHDLFTLVPGETKVLNEWTGQVTFVEPGTYRVVCHYANRPWIPPPSEAIAGQQDKSVLAQVAKSLPCELRSNAL